MKDITTEQLAQWIAELESQPHLSLREERYLAVLKRLLVFEEGYEKLPYIIHAFEKEDSI